MPGSIFENVNKRNALKSGEFEEPALQLNLLWWLLNTNEYLRNAKRVPLPE